MYKYAACLLGLWLGLVRVSAAQEDLHVYYEGGDTMEQIADHGLILTVTLRDTSKENWVWVYVANSSNEAVNIIPANIKLHQSLPKNEELRMKTERELGKSVDRKVFWGQILAGVGAGLSRNLSTVRTTDAYGNSLVTTINTPDYESQARWLAWADQLTQKGQSIKDFHQHDWLRATTLFPGSQYAGRLIFVRNKRLESGTVHVTLDSKEYEFPFPPPKTAGPPQTAPALPNLGSVTAAASTNEHKGADPANKSVVGEGSAQTEERSTKAGILGLSGANWEEGGVRGVEILGVAENSAAESGGLRSGNVITDMNGRKIHTTQELAAALSQNGPGSRITVGYMFKSNLGWMPKETVIVLTNGN